MTESLSPQPRRAPETRVQASFLSLRSTANTVSPDEQLPPPGPQSATQGAPRRRLWFFAALSTICAGLGLAAAVGARGHVTSEVRSGSPGFRSTPSGKQIHWSKKAVTLYLDDSIKRVGPGAEEAVMQAFGQWVGSDPKLPNLSFDTGQTSATPRQDGMSTVSYSKITVPGHERDVAITMTYSNDKTGEIIEADVVLNAIYPMGALTAKPRGGATNNSGEHSNKSVSEGESEDCGNRYDAQNVATHEAGHFFGLGEDMTERAATMFLSIDECETHKRLLSLTDTQAITTLYAAQEDPETAQAGPRACSFGISRHAEPAWAAGLVFGFALLRRRRSR